MITTIKLTPVSNLKDNVVIDNNLIIQETHDSHVGKLTIEGKNGIRRISSLMNVSLYDDLIIKDKVRYKIIHMYTRNKSTLFKILQ